MISEIAILGYLTVLERLKLEIEPTPPMEGGVGRRILPTITCDAPIIGLSLSADGYKVDAVFNHPGKTKAALAAQELLQNNLNSCYFGPESGTPLALQVLSKSNEITWFADPSYGLNSLAKASDYLLSSEWLYFDAYPWLTDTIEQMSLNISKKGIFINFGTILQETFLYKIDVWRQKFRSKLLVCQASMGKSKVSSLSEISNIAKVALSKGADIILITAGETGLVLAKGNCVAIAQPYPFLHNTFSDSSGAGAAVSVELIKMLLSDSLSNLDENAKLLAIAGAKQCSISGALDSFNQKKWSQYLETGDSI